MKGAAWLAGGVVIGFLLGGFQPRRELAAAEAELDLTKDKLVKAERKAARRMLPPGLPGLDASLGLDEASDEDAGGRDDDEVAANEDGDEDAPEGAAPRPPGDPPSPAGKKLDDWDTFNTAVDAQRLRARQSRDALAEQAELTESQMAEIDAVIGDMNADLEEYAAEVLAMAEEQPNSRETLGLAHDLTGVLYESQSRFDAIVGDAGLEGSDESTTQIWNYVDLDIFRGALEERGGPQGLGMP